MQAALVLHTSIAPAGPHTSPAGARSEAPQSPQSTGEAHITSQLWCGTQALQSRFGGQRLGALGALLGDKAAEVTAMAQQSLGDPTTLQSAFTSAFSQLGGGAGAASGILSSLRFKGAE